MKKLDIHHALFPTLSWNAEGNQAPVRYAIGEAEAACFRNARLRVEASAGMSRQPGYGYSGPWYFTLDPAVRKYSFTFTMRQDSDWEARYQFNLGQAGNGTLIIEDIVITGPFWANMDRIPRLVLPDRIKTDPHVLIQFHPCLPGDFRFQGSSGNGFADRHVVRWRGTRAEKDAIVRLFDGMEAWAARNDNLRLCNGEFGAHAAAPSARGSLREDRLRWVRFIRNECERRGISWTYYDFCKEGVKVYDVAAGTWDRELVDTLYGE